MINGILTGMFVRVAYIADYGNFHIAPKLIKVDHRKRRRATLLSTFASVFEQSAPPKKGSITIRGLQVH